MSATKTAIEAILLGGSLIQLKVAILKPVSSAVSIGTGGPFGAEGPIIMRRRRRLADRAAVSFDLRRT
jgi:H+/Cl- antiporter ClcA